MIEDSFVGLGVDVGGTFTDAVVLTGSGIFAAKRPTTPDDQASGAIDAALAALAAAGHEPGEVTRFVHGMTVTTNALLENKVARTALVATAGFEDLEELARQNRPSLYDLDRQPPAALTSRGDRIGALERCGPDGVITALDTSALDTAISALPDEIESVAVSLLFSFRHPAHELAVAAAIEQLRPGLHVSLSHRVVGTFREYERCSTTVTDAAVTPLVANYLKRLSRRAADSGLPQPLVMVSSGGTVPLQVAAARGALTVLSGPAGGAAGGASAARTLDLEEALCIDMGGTSTDVSLVQDGTVAVTASRGVGGRPLALPAVDIVTVGAGGGSIGWSDDAGALAVGPHSAGAVPGPASYQRGGHEPTVTDANLVLGYVEDGWKLGNEVVLSLAAARDAVQRLGDQIGLDIEQAAAGIVKLANAEMSGALRQVSVARGVDPRRLALISFGGAAGLHCAALADDLEIERVHCPPASGTLSALGMLRAPLRSDSARSVVRDLDQISDKELAALTRDVEQHAASFAAVKGVIVSHQYELRYRGQSHELVIDDASGTAQGLREQFEQTHLKRYGYRDPEGAIELVTIRATVTTAAGSPHAIPATANDADPGRDTKLWFDGCGWIDAIRVKAPRPHLIGPAAIDLPDTTVIVPPGWLANPQAGGITLERSA